MMVVVARLLGPVIAGVVVLSPHPPAADALRPAYGAFRAQLDRSAVPVLLPAHVPKAIGPIASVTVISSGRDGYYIGLSAVPNCGGALSCASLHVAGFAPTSSAARAYGHDQPVRLSDRAQGFYAPPDCSGSSCTEASLTFKRAGVVYEIDSNVEPQPLLVLIAIYRELRCFERKPNECHGR
jgi:hypothetical protein